MRAPERSDTDRSSDQPPAQDADDHAGRGACAARRRERGRELERLAADRAEATGALAQRVLVDRREVQPQRAGALPVEVGGAPGHERDLAREAAHEQVVRVEAARQRGPQEQAALGRRPARAGGKLGRERARERVAARPVDVALRVEQRERAGVVEEHAGEPLRQRRAAQVGRLLAQVELGEDRVVGRDVPDAQARARAPSRASRRRSRGRRDPCCAATAAARPRSAAPSTGRPRSRARRAGPRARSRRRAARARAPRRSGSGRSGSGRQLGRAAPRARSARARRRGPAGIDAVAVDRHVDDVGLGSHQHGDGTGIGRPLADHAVAGIEQHAREQVERLLAARRDQQVGRLGRRARCRACAPRAARADRRAPRSGRTAAPRHSPRARRARSARRAARAGTRRSTGSRRPARSCPGAR